MHQITVQQLSNRIPRLITQWSTDDVCLWLSLNQIQVQIEKIKAKGMVGVQIKSITPNQWMNQYGVTRYIARQIVQWLQEQSDEFQKLTLKRKQNAQSLLQDNKNTSEKCNIQFPSNQVLQKKVNQSQNIIKFNQIVLQSQLNALEIKKQKIKQRIKLHQYEEQQLSNQNMPLYYQQKSFPQKIQNELCILSKLKSKNKDALSRKQSNVKIKNCLDLKKGKLLQLQQNNQKKLEGQKIHSEITDRLEKIKKSKKNLKVEVQKQSKTIQNQIFCQFNKRKTDQNNKQLCPKQFKVYNYLNNQSILQRIKEGKLELKRVPTSQQICPSKMISPNQKMQEDIPTRQKTILSPTPSHPVNSPSLLSSPHIKFTTSQFIPYNDTQSNILLEKKLRIVTQQSVKIVSGFSRIGRNKNNQINFIDQTVSRQHAQIIKQQSAGQIRFYLKDVGSKFGTFVQCSKIQQNITGKSFLMGEAEVQILAVQVSRNGVNSFMAPSNNKKITFDMKIKVDGQKQLTILNRSIITIGKDPVNERSIQGGCSNFRLFLNEHKIICLEAIEGKMYQKIKAKVPWDIEKHVNEGNSVQVVFGWLKTTFEIVKLCKKCKEKRELCFCVNQRGVNN